MTIFTRFDHVAIGVEDIERARRVFVDSLGAEPMADAGENAKEGFRWETFRLGGRKVELVAPIEPGEGGVGRYIRKNGEGFHHVSIAVADLRAAIREFEARGVRVLAPNFDNPKWRHCYLHPKDTFGAMIQVFEECDETRRNAE
jgi:methylmalonyl-CoA/ethylmalonyl-CoA epimerase